MLVTWEGADYLLASSYISHLESENRGIRFYPIARGALGDP
jgi:hypothetical protein